MNEEQVIEYLKERLFTFGAVVFNNEDEDHYLLDNLKLVKTETNFIQETETSEFLNSFDSTDFVPQDSRWNHISIDEVYKNKIVNIERSVVSKEYEFEGNVVNFHIEVKTSFYETDLIDFEEIEALKELEEIVRETFPMPFGYVFYKYVYAKWLKEEGENGIPLRYWWLLNTDIAEKLLEKLTERRKKLNSKSKLWTVTDTKH